MAIGDAAHACPALRADLGGMGYIIFSRPRLLRTDTATLRLRRARLLLSDGLQCEATRASHNSSVIRLHPGVRAAIAIR